MQFVPLRYIGRRTRLSAGFRYDRGTDPTYLRWKVRAVGDCDLGGDNQYTPEVRVAGSWANLLAAKTEMSSESICSASLSQMRKRSRRAGRTHGNEDPKHWANVSRNGYPSLKGLRTPRFPSRPDIFNLQKCVVSAGSARCGMNSTNLIRQRQQIVVKQDRASSYRIVLWNRTR